MASKRTTGKTNKRPKRKPLPQSNNLIPSHGGLQEGQTRPFEPILMKRCLKADIYDKSLHNPKYEMIAMYLALYVTASATSRQLEGTPFEASIQLISSLARGQKVPGMKGKETDEDYENFAGRVRYYWEENLHLTRTAKLGLQANAIDVYHTLLKRCDKRPGLALEAAHDVLFGSGFLDDKKKEVAVSVNSDFESILEATEKKCKQQKS